MVGGRRLTAREVAVAEGHTAVVSFIDGLRRRQAVLEKSTAKVNRTTACDARCRKWISKLCALCGRSPPGVAGSGPHHSERPSPVLLPVPWRRNSLCRYHRSRI